MGAALSQRHCMLTGSHLQRPYFQIRIPRGLVDLSSGDICSAQCEASPRGCWIPDSGGSFPRQSVSRYKELPLNLGRYLTSLPSNGWRQVQSPTQVHTEEEPGPTATNSTECRSEGQAEHRPHGLENAHSIPHTRQGRGRTVHVDAQSCTVSRKVPRLSSRTRPCDALRARD